MAKSAARRRGHAFPEAVHLSLYSRSPSHPDRHPNALGPCSKPQGPPRSLPDRSILMIQDHPGLQLPRGSSLQSWALPSPCSALSPMGTEAPRGSLV